MDKLIFEKHLKYFNENKLLTDYKYEELKNSNFFNEINIDLEDENNQKAFIYFKLQERDIVKKQDINIFLVNLDISNQLDNFLKIIYDYTEEISKAAKAIKTILFIALLACIFSIFYFKNTPITILMIILSLIDLFFIGLYSFRIYLNKNFYNQIKKWKANHS